MDDRTITLVGRGDSAKAARPFDGPTIAVSSGVFVFDEDHPPTHAACLDPLKFFMAELWRDHMIAWQHDQGVRQWAFWSDHRVQKHVCSSHDRPTRYRSLPPEVANVVPERARQAFLEAMLESGTHVFGFQPGWGDQPNTRFYEVDKRYPPNFDDPSKVMGLGGIANTTLFAVQVAHQLGYRRLRFIGCDLQGKHHLDTVRVLREWHPLATAAGLEWVNLSSSSALAEFLPTMDGVTA